MRISDWSSDVCSSDLPYLRELRQHAVNAVLGLVDILQEKDRAIEIGQIRRSDQRGENRQIATKEPAHRLSRPNRPRSPPSSDERPFGYSFFITFCSRFSPFPLPTTFLLSLLSLSFLSFFSFFF